MTDQNLAILIVDDHPIVRQSLKEVIENSDLSVKVTEAWNGQEAIEHTRTDHPDLVLMDINMPVMNGIEATARIKAEFPSVKIIGISSKENHMEEKILAAGADSFISKETAGFGLYQAILDVIGSGRKV